jgi:hypothetical protein
VTGVARCTRDFRGRSSILSRTFEVVECDL